MDIALFSVLGWNLGVDSCRCGRFTKCGYDPNPTGLRDGIHFDRQFPLLALPTATPESAHQTSIQPRDYSLRSEVASNLMQRFLANYRARFPFHSRCPRCNESYERRQDRCTRCGFWLIVWNPAIMWVRVVVVLAHGIAFALFLFFFGWLFFGVALSAAPFAPDLNLELTGPGSVVVPVSFLLALVFLGLWVPTIGAVVLRVSGNKIKLVNELRESESLCPVCRCATKRRRKFCKVCGSRLRPLRHRTIQIRNALLVLALFFVWPICFWFFIIATTLVFHPEAFMYAGQPKDESFHQVLHVMNSLYLIFACMQFVSFIVYGRFLKETDEIASAFGAKSA